MPNMKALYARVAADPNLQQKFSQIMADAAQDNQKGDLSGQAATEEKLLAFAKEAGYEVTIQEMQAFFQGMAAQAEGELSDAELDQVAGGKSKVGTENVALSVLSFGTVCAVGSVIIEIMRSGDCTGSFQ